MAHNVVCPVCGKTFDYDAHGGSYDEKSRRYTCPSCVAASIRSANAAAAKKAKSAFAVKAAFALLFLLGGLTVGETGPALTGVVCFLFLTAWAVFGYRKAAGRHIWERSK